MPFNVRPIFFSLFLLGSLSINAQSIDLSTASVYVNAEDLDRLETVVRVLQQEVNKRTDIDLPIADQLARTDQPQIILLSTDQRNKLPKGWLNGLENLSEIGPEGFQLLSLPWVNKVLIVADDQRGALFGIGRLLRKMDMRAEQLQVPGDLRMATTPRYSIRGHQLGYRPKTNAYGARNWPSKGFHRVSNASTHPSIWAPEGGLCIWA